MTGTQRVIFGVAAGVGILWLFRDLGAAEDDQPGATSQERKVMSFWVQIQEASLIHLIDPAVISGMIQVESGGVITAKGRDGEVGLMQIMPATALTYCGVNVVQLLDPQTNITCGARYLAGNINLFVSLPAGIAAYNCGPGNVRSDLATQKLKIPASTLNYVKKVRAAATRFRLLWPEVMPLYKTYYTDHKWKMDWVWPFMEG